MNGEGKKRSGNNTSWMDAAAHRADCELKFKTPTRMNENKQLSYFHITTSWNENSPTASCENYTSLLNASLAKTQRKIQTFTFKLIFLQSVIEYFVPDW